MGSRWRRRRSISSNPASAKPKANFSPRKPLKFLDTRKESRTWRCWSASPRRNAGRSRESGPWREPRHFVAGFAPREADGKRSRPEMAPQRLEKIESAPGNGMGSEASNLQDVVHGCTAGHPRLRISGGPIQIGLTRRWGSSGVMKGNFSASQALEIPRNANGISAPAIARGAGGRRRPRSLQLEANFL